jgi:ribokinase
VRFAVVGHTEWVEFVEVERVPLAGEILHSTEAFDEAAGGGAVAAVQLARLAGGAEMITALGDDEIGSRSRERLADLGVRVHAATRDQPTRRALTFLDGNGERTITTIGDRLAPADGDELAWGSLEGTDGVYFTAGDAAALRAARRAKVLVATPRAGPVLGEAGVELDALVFSEDDELERAAADRLEPRPGVLVGTRGAQGGRYVTADGTQGEWPAAEVPGSVADTYGCGDSFAAALTYGLGTGQSLEDALALAARAGATCLTGRGPYERQLARSAS